MRYILATNRLAHLLDPEGWCEHVDDLSINLDCTRYVFLPFWSEKVPKEITDKVECVCFHMAPVPYGRGGSPLQHMILRGYADTIICALRMTDEMDAGPVYMQRPLSLEGSAQEIYERAAGIIASMMREIAATEPTPVPQEGEVVTFERRKPDQSYFDPNDFPSARGLYDFIRMLDADGYPRAFTQMGSRRFEFSNARLVNGKLTAKVVIS